jgi:hypothetical protein
MTMTRLAIPLAGLALALAPAASGADVHSAPPVVRAKSGHRVAAASLGSYCWRSFISADIAGIACGDAQYPLPTRGALPSRPRAALVLSTSAPVDSLTACLERTTAGAKRAPGACVRLARGPDGKWRGHWPRDLHGANRLAVGLSSGDGSAGYSLALRR